MRLAMSFALLIGTAGAALAGPATGTWQTEPDKKGIIAHVNVYDCGNAVCGEITRTFNSKGQEIKAASLGQKVIRNATPTGNGKYEGRAWVPAHQREYPAGMTVRGDRMTVRGCMGPVCMSQNWTRIQ